MASCGLLAGLENVARVRSVPLVMVAGRPTALRTQIERDLAQSGFVTMIGSLSGPVLRVARSVPMQLMVVIDGLEDLTAEKLCETMNNGDPRLRRCPVFIVAGELDEQREFELLERGAFGCAAGHEDPHVLRTRLMAALRNLN